MTPLDRHLATLPPDQREEVRYRVQERAGMAISDGAGVEDADGWALGVEVES